jgi:hypothetical protein
MIGEMTMVVATDAFGTAKEWSTWSGAEIAQRTSNYLRSKMDEAKTSGTPRFASRMEQFFNPVAPPITLDDYVKRIIHYTRVAVSPVNIGVALMYIERIQKRELCDINDNTIFRLFLTAFLVAFKRMDDPPVMKNKDYSKIAGVSLRELNEMEIIFVKALDFDLGVGDDEEVCRRITHILVPSMKRTSSIVCDSRVAESATLYRCTPDSVADLESHVYYANQAHMDGFCSSGSGSERSSVSEDLCDGSGGGGPFEAYWRQREASYEAEYGTGAAVDGEVNGELSSENSYDVDGYYGYEDGCLVEGSQHGASNQGSEKYEYRPWATRN